MAAKTKSFWDTHEVKSGGGYLSADEKAALVASEQVFEITAIRTEEAKGNFPPRFVLTLDVPDPVTGDAEKRFIGLAIGSGVDSRDEILQAMLDDHFGVGETDPIPAKLGKGGNAFLILPA